jgi:hypothetical protein
MLVLYQFVNAAIEGLAHGLMPYSDQVSVLTFWAFAGNSSHWGNQGDQTS